MARGLSLVSLLATLLVVGWLLTAQNGQGPTRAQTTQAVDQAAAAAAGIAFQQAEAQLEQGHALNGTYAGASLAGFGVTLVRADASTYCLQNGAGSTLTHLAGPGGTAAPGPC
jgi:hypothetical protein